MRRADLITGIALVIIAIAFVARISLRSDAKSPSELPAGENSAMGPEKNPNTSVSLSTSLPSGARHRVSDAHFHVKVDPTQPAASGLVEHAKETAKEARFRLGLLTKQLDLSKEQRDAIFPLLARAAKNYDPAMSIAGAASDQSALNDRQLSRAIQSQLDPAQRDQLIEDALNDALLWQEIIGKLEEKLREATQPQQDDNPSSSDPEESPLPASATHGGGNVLDLLNANP